MMKEGLLEKIAEVVNENSDSYTAAVPPEKMKYMKVEGASLGEYLCRVIRISRKGKRKNHVSKGSWCLFEPDIEKVITKMVRKEKRFDERIEQLKITPTDVETIIRRCSYQILKLRLAQTPYERLKDLI